MPKWSDIGGVWSTLRELDINAIRDEAERPLFIALIGQLSAIDLLSERLRNGAERYAAAGVSPLGSYPLPLEQGAEESLRRADLLILALDTRLNPPSDIEAVRMRLERLAIPVLVVQVFADRLGATSGTVASLRGIAIGDLATPEATQTLVEELLRVLPGELHLAAARRLPALRSEVASNLVSQTSMTNAIYALGSGLPEQIPVLSVPFAAADILVLTKNQGLMVYKLALAMGAAPNFQERMAEIIPVVGGAFVWRQIARSLIGLIPVWGLLPKIAVSYAGTYATGQAAWAWYARGDKLSPAQLSQVTGEALEVGRAQASKLLEQARDRAGDAGSSVGGFIGSTGQWLKSWVPGRRRISNNDN